MHNLNENPSSFRYLLGVRGDEETVFCPKDCSDKGQCLNGLCSCHEKFMGSSCEFAPSILELNSPKEITILKNQMAFIAVETNLGKSKIKLFSK